MRTRNDDDDHRGVANSRLWFFAAKPSFSTLCKGVTLFLTTTNVTFEPIQRALSQANSESQ